MVREVFTPQQLISYEKVPTQIFATAEEASRAVAAEMAALIRSKQESGEYAVLGLATGSTPKRVYAELVRLHREEGLSFRNVVSFNLDEYYPLSADALQSYHRFMKENLFRYIDIAKEIWQPRPEDEEDEDAPSVVNE